MQNHLFIGLGGQGGKSLAEIRKVIAQREDDARFLENQKVKWDFLHIDSSTDVRNTRSFWTHFGKDLSLAPSSFLHLKDGQVPSAAVLGQRPDVAPWIGDSEIVDGFLQGAAQIEGANQRRRFGRLLAANHADHIYQALVRDKVAKLTNGRENECWLHVFASLAGGTGSGTIVDIVTLLRTQYQDRSVDGGFPIFLYLFATAEECEDDVGYFHQNQYAALRDLNAVMCGRLESHLLGARYGGDRFTHREPVNGLVLISSINDQNQALSLNRQIKIVSESAFERLYAFCSGNLDPSSQKALTGQDIQTAFPGEPIRNPLRSYLFGSLGMRRWEIPTEEVQELLCNELYRSAFRQMLYDNWQDETGFVSQPSDGNAALRESILGRLKEITSSELVSVSELSQLSQRLNNDLDNIFKGLSREGLTESSLDDLENKVEEFYRDIFGDHGAAALFSAFAQNRGSRIERVKKSIDDALKDAWLATGAPLGLAYVPQILSFLQSQLREQLGNGSTSDSGQAQARLKQRRDLRRQEWRKITFLSHHFGKRSSLARAHLVDVKADLREDLRRRAGEEDQGFLDLFVRELSTLENHYRQALEQLRVLEEDVNVKCELIGSELRNLHSSDSANKYELDVNAMDRFLEDTRRSRTHMRNASDSLRNLVINSISNRALSDIRSLSGDRKAELWERFDAECFPRVEAIHSEFVHEGETRPIFGSSLLSRLEEKHENDPDLFKREMKDFVDLATTCAKLDRGQTQPATLIGGGQGVPHMPGRILVLGLPRNHAFSDVLRTQIKDLIGAGTTYRYDSYEHDDPTQVRLLVVDCWMAARFAVVITGLKAHYERSLQQNVGSDVAYFANIDPDGEKDRRPSLLLPTPEENRNRLSAELWLGQQLSEPAVVEDDNGIFLRQETEEGITPSRIGDSLQQVVDSADIAIMARVEDVVQSAILKLSEDQIEALRAVIAKEDKSAVTEHGETSKAYLEWLRVRDELYRLVQQ